MENYEFHPWEIWNGGECPCPGEMVQVQCTDDTRRGATYNAPTLAQYFRWSHEGYGGDIIAFRRVKTPEVKTCFGFFDDDLGGWLWGTKHCPSDTHKLTFNVDSEGNPYNFNCERIK